MALLPTTVQFKPGEPMPATKFNGLVGASAELSGAFAAEHREDGRHVGLRFETAFASVVWDPSSSAWRPHGKQRGLQGHVRDGTVGPNPWSPLFTITDPELAEWPKERLGFLAYDLLSIPSPVHVIDGNDITIYDPPRFTTILGNRPNMLTLIAFGLTS